MKFNPLCKKPNTCEECTDRCINKLPFFASLPDESQIALMKKAVRKTFHKGETVFSEGDFVESVTLIRSGQIKLCTYDSEGRERITGIFADNDVIWEGVFLKGSTYPYTGVCLTNVDIISIYRKDIEKAISNPSVALEVINLLSVKLHNANERNMILSTSDPMTKIGAFLIYREKQTRAEVIKLTLNDIAGSIGLRPETVSRYLQKLIKAGYIKKVGKTEIVITDYEGLNNFVNSI